MVDIYVRRVRNLLGSGRRLYTMLYYYDYYNY